MEKIIKRYNGIMYDLGNDHLTIGTRGSEFPEEKAQWNLRDMVSECQYQLDLLEGWGTYGEELRESDNPEDRKAYRSLTGKLRRFINRYKEDIEDMNCFIRHSSMYD